jgi:hypothetical protein
MRGVYVVEGNGSSSPVASAIAVRPVSTAGSMSPEQCEKSLSRCCDDDDGNNSCKNATPATAQGDAPAIARDRRCQRAQPSTPPSLRHARDCSSTTDSGKSLRPAGNESIQDANWPRTRRSIETRWDQMQYLFKYQRNERITSRNPHHVVDITWLNHSATSTSARS